MTLIVFLTIGVVAFVFLTVFVARRDKFLNEMTEALDNGEAKRFIELRQQFNSVKFFVWF